MKQPQTRSLNSLLLRLLVLRLFLPSLILAFLVLGVGGYLRERTLEYRQLQLGSLLAFTIDDYLDQASRALGAVALVAETITPEELTTYMQATWQATRYFDTLYLLDKNGVIRLLAPPDPRYQGLDMSRQPYFRRADAPVGVMISQPFISLRTGQPTAYMSWPLTSGSLVGELNLGALQESVMAGHIVPDRDLVFITDRSGNLLAHPQSDLVAQQTNMGSLEIVQHDLVDQTSLIYLTDGVFYLGSAAPVNRTGWIVVTQIPLLTAYGPYLGVTGTTLLSLLAIWLIIVWSLRKRFNVHIVTPLARLSQGADALAAGNYAQGEALVAISTALAEMDALGANFHRMSRAIQARQVALQKSETRYRTLFDSARDGLYIIDMQGRYIDVNPAACQLLDYSREELLAIDVFQVGARGLGLSPEQRAQLLEHLQVLWRKGEIGYETQLLTKSGELIPVKMTITPLTYHGQEAALGAVRDITGRVQAEQLQEAVYRIAQAADRSPRLDDLFQAVHEIIRDVMDAGNFYIALYDEEADLLSFPYFVDEVDDPPSPFKPGKGLTEYILRTAKSLLCDLATHEELERCGEVDLIGAPSPIWLGVPLITENKVIGVMTVQHYSDAEAYGEREQRVLEFVSTQVAKAIDRKRAEESLRESEERLRTVVTSAPIVLFMLDREGMFTLSEGKGLEALGSKPGEAVGRSALQMYSDIPQVIESIHHALAGKAVASVNEVAGLVFDTRYAPLRDQSGEVAGVIGVGVDVTGQARAREEIKRRNRELAALNALAAATSESLNLDTILDAALQQIVAFTGVDGAECHLPNDDGDLALAMTWGLDKAFAAASRDFHFSVGEGIPGRAFARRAPVYVSDAPANKCYWQRDLARAAGYHSLLCVPILGGEALRGTFTLYCCQTRQFTPEMQTLLMTVGRQLAVAIERARLYENTVRQTVELAILNEIAKNVSQSLELKTTLDNALAATVAALKGDVGGIYLRDHSGSMIELVATQGLEGDLPDIVHRRPVGKDLVGQVLQANRLLQVANMSINSHLRPPELEAWRAQRGLCSFLGAPLQVQGEATGVISVITRTLRDFSDQDEQMLVEISRHASVAIENARLFENLQRANDELAVAYDATLEGWARALELRDMETKGHSQRVTEMTLRLARAMGISEAELVHIRRGALLHDIGKMGIPDRILHKPGPLTNDERETMQFHPEYAYKMLLPIAYLRPALDIPRYHHERWDGTGYPCGLEGEQIPQAARIFAVVDVWDALLSDRPYRDAWLEEDAREYIREQAGVCFDPYIVDVFLSLKRSTFHIQHSSGY